MSSRQSNVPAASLRPDHPLPCAKVPLFAKCGQSLFERPCRRTAARVACRLHRARSAGRSKPLPRAVRGSGKPAGTVDESATGSVNLIHGWKPPVSLWLTRLPAVAHVPHGRSRSVSSPARRTASVVRLRPLKFSSLCGCRRFLTGLLRSSGGSGSGCSSGSVGSAWGSPGRLRLSSDVLRRPGSSFTFASTARTTRTGRDRRRRPSVSVLHAAQLHSDRRRCAADRLIPSTGVRSVRHRLPRSGDSLSTRSASARRARPGGRGRSGTSAR